MKNWMMTIRRKLKKMTPTQHVTIITVFVLLVSIMIGYSVMDNPLQIEGNSRVSTSALVRIKSITLKNITGGTPDTPNIEGNIKGIIPVKFTDTGSAIYEGIVVNMGSSEVILSTINLLNESNNSNPSCIQMSIDGLKVGDKLTPSQEQKFTITVTSNCSETSSKNNEFSLSYIPVNPTEGTTTVDERLTNLENQVNALKTENEKLRSVTHNNNLLINSNFQVNQDGKTSWTSASGYTVDMWYLYRHNNDTTNGTSGSAVLNNKIMKLTNKDFYFTALNTPIENNLAGKTVTFSIKVTAVSGNVNIRLADSPTIGGVYAEKSYSITRINEPGITTVTTKLPDTLPDGNLKLTVLASADSSISFEWVKVEEGEVATPYTTKLYTDEFLDCERYYRKVNYSASFHATAANQQRVDTIAFDVPMRTTPTVTVVSNGTNTNSTTTAAGSETGLTLTMKASATGTASLTNRKYVLDARYQ